MMYKVGRCVIIYLPNQFDGDLKMFKDARECFQHILDLRCNDIDLLLKEDRGVFITERLKVDSISINQISEILQRYTIAHIEPVYPLSNYLIDFSFKSGLIVNKTEAEMFADMGTGTLVISGEQLKELKEHLNKMEI